MAGFHLAHAHVVAGHRDGFDQRGQPQGKSVREAVQSVGRHGPKSLQSARGIDPDELQVVADVALAGAARRAVSAGIERPHRDTIARLPAFHPRSHRRNGARHLMAHHVRQPKPVRHRAVEQV